MRIRTTASTPSPALRRCHPDLTRRILLPAPTGRGRYWHPPSTRGSSLEHFSVRGRRSLQVLLHIWPLQSTIPRFPPLKSVCCKTILNSCPCRKPKRKMVLKGFWLNVQTWIQMRNEKKKIQTSAVFNCLMPKVVSRGRCNPPPFKLSKTLILAYFQLLELLVHVCIARMQRCRPALPLILASGHSWYWSVND